MLEEIGGEEEKVSNTIAVGGVMPRIGTTTQAIQIAMYLQDIGYQTCYVEMNTSGYLNGMCQLYRGIKRRNGCLEYKKLIFYDREGFQKVSKERAVFMVKDYGCIKEPLFEEMSLLEQEIKLLVCGIKANEILDTELAIERFGEKCDGFLFNFVSSEDRKWIKRMMGEKAKKTYFTDFAPDPFTYTLSCAAVYQSFLWGKKDIPSKSIKQHFFLK